MGNVLVDMFAAEQEPGRNPFSKLEVVSSAEKPWVDPARPNAKRPGKTVDAGDLSFGKDVTVTAVSPNYDMVEVRIDLKVVDKMVKCMVTRPLFRTTCDPKILQDEYTCIPPQSGWEVFNLGESEFNGCSNRGDKSDSLKFTYGFPLTYHRRNSAD